MYMCSDMMMSVDVHMYMCGDMVMSVHVYDACMAMSVHI